MDTPAQNQPAPVPLPSVNPSTQPVTSGEPTRLTTPNTFWHYNAFLFLVAGVVLGSFGTYFVLAPYLSSNPKETHIASVPVAPSTAPTSLPTVTPAEPVFVQASSSAEQTGWSMHTNQLGGYRFECPDALTYSHTDYSDDCIGGTQTVAGLKGGPNFTILFQDSTKPNKNVSLLPPSKLGKQTVHVGGVEANIEFNALTGITIGEFQKGTIIYKITYWDTKTTFTQVPDQLQKIINSFVFLK